jgi:hypothetical protein
VKDIEIHKSKGEIIVKENKITRTEGGDRRKYVRGRRKG